MNRSRLLVGCVLVMVSQSCRGQSAPTPTPPPRTAVAAMSISGPGGLGVGVAYAQYTKFTLLELPAVQKELKITPQLMARIKTVEEEHDRLLNQTSKELVAALKERGNSPAPEVREELAREGRIRYQEIMRQGDALLEKVLDPPRRTRLRELQIQAEGPMAFTRDDMMDRLNIGPDQEEQIAMIVAQGPEAMAAAVSAAVPPGTVPDLRTVARERHKEIVDSKAYQAAVAMKREAAIRSRQATMQAIGKVLTKKQRANYEQMRGEPFAPFQPASGNTTEERPQGDRPSPGQPRP